MVGSSLRFRFLVVAASAALMVFGVQQLRATQVDVFPEFAPPKVEVQTPALGLSASEVESLVTVPLEMTLNGVPGLDTIRSKSVEQLSSIEMIFTPGTDLLTARQHVAERIALVTPGLPTWASPPFMIQPLSATSRVLKIGLSSVDSTVDLIDMSMAAYWTIRTRLLKVPGVANVPIWGERLEMLQVQVDPERLTKHDVTQEEVLTVTADALDSGLIQYSEGNYIGRGGFIDGPRNRVGVQYVLPFTEAPDLAKLPVTTRSGKTITLDQVADLKRDHQPLVGDAVVNDGPGLMLIVEKLPWANTLDVTRGVDQALAELTPGLKGMQVDPSIFRPATFIEESISNLSSAMWLGALLMVLMLCLFLYDWRTAVISVVAIPLSLVAAGLVLHATGTTINTMILAGMVIALGDIVDDAIIGVENVVRRLRQHRAAGTGARTAKVILEASLEVRSAIVYATLIEIVAIAPIFMLEGLSGSFFRPLATAYALALGASMLVALTVTPAMSLILFRKPTSLMQRRSPVVPPLQRGYQAVLARIVRRPRKVYAVVAVVTAAGVFALPFLGSSLLPSFKERDFLMHWVSKPGTGQPEMYRISRKANEELLTIPGVRNAGSHIGQALLMDEVVGIDFGENWISVDPSVDYDTTLDRIREVVDGYPGLRRDVLTYLKERIREVLTGSSEAITIRIYGPDLKVLREQAAEVNEVLGGIPGVIENHVETQEDIPQVRVTVNLAAAEGHGLKPGDVRRAASQLLAGEEAGDIFAGGKAHDVQVWSTPQTRRNLTDVQNLLIDTPRGGRVRLREVADVEVVPVPNVIHHDDLSRSIDVGANIDGSRDLGSVVADLETRLAQEVRWPSETYSEMLGEFTERQAATTRLNIFAGAAALGIFLLLQASFGSWRLATLSFLTLPIALVGGVVAAMLTGRVISLGSLVGFFTVLGIVARNGIMLISHYQHLERFEGVPFGPGLVVQGARERLVPILMTVLTTGLALIPLIAAGSVPGQEIEHPMAIVILGGLISATLLNLFVVPSLYLRFARPMTAPEPTTPPAPATGSSLSQ
ncbi:efflux RND transporter permease subunit [Intrasporangium sp.]|uniref:efflux RND transporter permease subunit n=1 Tax=Intrasporangium sp. TaxID=1925024 RepID=UPI002D77DBA7|nr:efflux RND transporter permease subunit [Intrasporangium sp.]